MNSQTNANAIKIQKFHLQVNAGFTWWILVPWHLVLVVVVLVVNCLAADDE